MWSANFANKLFKFSSINPKYDNNLSETIYYCIFYFESYLLFTNANYFQKNVETTLDRWECMCLKENSNYKILKKEYINKSARNRLFIFDFNTITQIDITGLDVLKFCIKKILSETQAECVYFLNTKRKFIF